MLIDSLTGLGPFIVYFTVSLVALIVFKFIYTLVTPHDEWALVKQNNAAAAVALIGTLIGYAIALSGAASNSVNLIDFIIWAIVALAAQLLAYGIIRAFFLREVVRRIEGGEMAAGIVLAGLSVAVGLLNAACMTW